MLVNLRFSVNKSIFDFWLICLRYAMWLVNNIRAKLSTN